MQVFRSFGAQLLQRALGRRAGRGAEVLRAAAASATRRSSSTASRAPQPDRARDGAGDGAAAARSRGAPPGADRRGRLRRQPLLRRAAGARRSRPSIATGSSSTSARSRRSCSRACGWAGSWPAADPRAAAGGQAARRPAHERAAPGGRAPLLRAPAARPPCRARRHASTARRRALLLAALRRRMPDGVTWTEPQGGFSLLVTLPAGLDGRAALLPQRDRARAWRSRPAPPFFVDGGGQRDAAALVLVGAGRPDRRGRPAAGRRDQEPRVRRPLAAPRRTWSARRCRSSDAVDTRQGRSTWTD